jgi:hypothetical protein
MSSMVTNSKTRHTLKVAGYLAPAISTSQSALAASANASSPRRCGCSHADIVAQMSAKVEFLVLPISDDHDLPHERCFIRKWSCKHLCERWVGRRLVCHPALYVNVGQPVLSPGCLAGWALTFVQIAVHYNQ